jgi:signal transduction histidine kinase/CheY-like chemotaxis protein
MWLDVLLFSTGAFSGTPNYLRIMQGTLVSRFFISLFALPFLYGYLRRQSWRSDISLQNRPVLAILQRVAEMEAELSLAEREIQRRRQAETALRESKALLDATGRLANVGGWHVDLPSREVRWTEQTRRMHEVPPDYEPTLEAAIAFYHPQDQAKLRAALQRAMEQGEPFDSELRFITAQGSHRWVHVLCRPHVVDGETVELLGAFQDITEQKEIEEQLRRRERMAAIGQMASGIAHDFRNRVNAILLYAEMVLDHHSVPAAVTRGLETIIKESRGIAELVQQMLDFSGRSMIELRPLDLAQMVDEAVESLQPQLPDDVQVSVERGPGATVVEADRERILQALDNLVSNALDAMPEGGTLSLTLSRVQVTPDGPSPGLNGRGWLPSDLPDGNWVCLSVSDTGTGMTEEMRQHLFEPFFTTKDIDQGTGLGLPQVYGIVRQHEGMVDVETTLGEGTTVRIYLPAYDDAAPARPRERPLEQTRTTVLLVEQNDALRHAERDLLESLGYRVLTARSGREALTVSQSPRWSGTPSNCIDVIIIPLEMPRMRGTELIERLTKPRPHAKAIAVSERALEEEDVASLREAGFAEVLSKPLEVEALAQVLLRVLNDE